MTLSIGRHFIRAWHYAGGVIDGLFRLGQSLPILEVSNEPMQEFRAALLGMRREQISKVLGVPPTACMCFGAMVRRTPRPVSYMDASTWYYPFDVSRMQALAIRFVGDRARAVEFIVAG